MEDLLRLYNEIQSETWADESKKNMVLLGIALSLNRMVKG